MVEKSYSTFRHPDVTPIKKLDDKTYILELFHGPTFAFKDVALQLLGNLFEFFLARRNARKDAGEKQEQLTVVGATSGDTGRYVRDVLSPSIILNLHLVPQYTDSEINLTSPSSLCIRKVAFLPYKRHK